MTNKNELNESKTQANSMERFIYAMNIKKNHTSTFKGELLKLVLAINVLKRVHCTIEHASEEGEGNT